MSTVSDLTGVAALAGAGFVGYQIWKNRDSIGGFFGGIQSGVDDLTKAIGNVGSSFQSAGEQTIKVVVDVQNNASGILEKTGIVDEDAPGPVKVLQSIDSGAGLTGPKIVAGAIDNVISEQIEQNGSIIKTDVDLLEETVEQFQQKNVTTATNGIITAAVGFIDSLINNEDKGPVLTQPTKTVYQDPAEQEYQDRLSYVQSLVDSGYKSPSSGDETKTGKIKTTSEFEDKGIGKLFNLLGFKKITYT